MSLLGGLFGHRSPTQSSSLFGGVMEGAQPDPTLAALAASTGNFSGPTSAAVAAAAPSQSRALAPVGTGLPDFQPGQAPNLSPSGAPSGPSLAAPTMGAPTPSPDDLRRRLGYAQELGIDTKPHKFNWGHAIATFFGGLPVAQALLAGDYAKAGQLNAQGRLVAARSGVAQATQLQRLSVYSALRDSGVPKNEAIVAMTNTEKLGENFNTRYRTDDIAPGHTRMQPNLDGSASSYTAPNLVQHGADYQFVTPSGGPGSSGPIDGNRPDVQRALGGGAPSIPMLPAAPSQTATLGASGRQISIPGADDGEADAFVRKGIDAGASADQIAGALKQRFGYSDDVLGRVTQALGPAIQWKQNNPNAPYQAEVTLGAPEAAPARPSLPGPPRGAPMLGTPRANVVAAGSLRTDAEQYADALGLDRGSPEWLSAVKDEMLKANGPTAFGQAQQLQGQRLGVQMRGQDITSGNNVRTNDTARRGQDLTDSRGRRGQDLADSRGRYIHDTPAARPVTQGTVIGGILAKRAGGQQLTPAEQGTLRDYYLGRGGRPQQEKAQAKAPEGTVIAGPNGHSLVKRGGRWVDSVTGQPAL